MNKVNLYIDTCVLPRCDLGTAKIYRDEYGKRLGLELLLMFDLPAFEENLISCLPMFSEGPLIFHEPVWGVEHSAPKGSAAYENGMYHILLAKKYAEILHPTEMVYHLNNCPVTPQEKENMLRISLENLEEMRDLFPDTRLLVENTGTDTDGCRLLEQEEFVELCNEKKLDVLLDVGHANASSWDIPKVVRDLKDRIRGFHLHNNDGCHDLHNRLEDGTIDFRMLLPFLCREIPDAFGVIEYVRPVYHGQPLLEDIRTAMDLCQPAGSAADK